MSKWYRYVDGGAPAPDRIDIHLSVQHLHALHNSGQPQFAVPRQRTDLTGLIGNRKADAGVKKRAEELFDLMGIARVKNNMANKMSGGKQQRTAIARALMNNPKIFLADEPTGNLDSENTAVIYRIFRDVNRQSGTTFIIITHDRRIAEQTDRIIEIKDGRIVMDLLR